MPRFLNTFTGEFESHDDPSKVVYAILSHTWRSRGEGGEQVYKSVLQLQAEAAEPWKSSRPSVAAGSPYPFFSHPNLSDKIRGICEVARDAGYRLLWFDACCIDQSNSAEVSTSLNSMFDWYRLANVCYVYLSDVPDGDDPARAGSKFRTSRWHTRGWTLQEIIAPERVVFLTRTWGLLGTKLALAPTLEEITGIDFHVLTGRDAPDSVSVAKRMSWAAGRQTKFVEDRAYSLLGIFGVHIAPIYGEGDNAFLRLQEEIIKTIPDQSVFAWGRGYTLKSLGEGSQADPAGQANAPGLLASSPSDFRSIGDVTSLSPSAFVQHIGNGIAPSLHCVFTPQGVHARFHCIDLTKIPLVYNTFFSSSKLCALCESYGFAHALALLQCKDENGSLIALPLRRTHAGKDEQEGLAVATHSPCGDPAHVPFRVVRLSTDVLAAMRPSISPDPRPVSLLRHYVEPTLPKSRQPGFAGAGASGLELWPGDVVDGVIIEVAPRCEAELRAIGFTVGPLRFEERAQRRIVVVLPLQNDAVKITLRLTLTHLERYGDGLTNAEFFPQVRDRLPKRTIQADGARLARSLFSTASPRAALAVSASVYKTQIIPPESGMFRARATTEQVLAQYVEQVEAEATERADPGAEDAEDERDVRLLRATLERPVDTTTARGRKTLLVAVELSQRYRPKKQYRPEKTVASPPRLLAGANDAAYGEFSGGYCSERGAGTQQLFLAPRMLTQASAVGHSEILTGHGDTGKFNKPGTRLDDRDATENLA